MALHAAGDNVTVDGIAVTLTSWPANDNGFFTWTQYLQNGATASGTQHTSNTTVTATGALPGDSAGNPANDSLAAGDPGNNMAAQS